MDHLVDTKLEDLHQGDVFYRVKYDGGFTGPFIVMSFRINQKTRKLPWGSWIGYHKYDSSCHSGVYAYDPATKDLRWHSSYGGGAEFKVDPTAEILIQGIAV